MYDQKDMKGSILPELVEMICIDVKGTVERWPPFEGAEEEDEVGPLELLSYKLVEEPAVDEVGAGVALLWDMALKFEQKKINKFELTVGFPPIADIQVRKSLRICS